MDNKHVCTFLAAWLSDSQLVIHFCVDIPASSGWTDLIPVLFSDTCHMLTQSRAQQGYLPWGFHLLYFCSRLMKEFEQLPCHLTEQPHLFSMDDLYRAKKSQLVAPAKAVLRSALEHVETCEVSLKYCSFFFYLENTCSVYPTQSHESNCFMTPSTTSKAIYVEWKSRYCRSYSCQTQLQHSLHTLSNIWNVTFTLSTLGALLSILLLPLSKNVLYQS